MPNRNGFELLQDIRALGSENGDSVSVIAMTVRKRSLEQRSFAPRLPAWVAGSPQQLRLVQRQHFALREAGRQLATRH